jgi:3-oxoacyl-[acyl-carrier-protein] synthase II
LTAAPERKRPAGAPDVAVTGIGIVTAFGAGLGPNWDAMRAGRSGVAPIRRFAATGLGTRFAATADPGEPPCVSPGEATGRLAATAVAEALLQSGHGEGPFPGRLFVGIPPVQMEWPDRLALAHSLDRPAESYADLLVAARHWSGPPIAPRLRFGETARRLARRFRTFGPPVTVSTACSSGATAICMACEAIWRGEAEAAIAVGADASVSPEMIARFNQLSALSRRNDDPATASRPFDRDRDGFVPGEGAGALVLERADTARRRGARILGIVAGAAECADGHHRIRHTPDGSRIADAMRAAVADAGLGPADIDYVNAHGTSTVENDRVEALGCRLVFGARADRVPVSSLKSMIGHTLSASGAIEAALTLVMLMEQTLLPTINHAMPDPEIDLDVVPNAARPAPLRHALSNSFGFGGQNVSLVLSAAP